MSGGPADLGPRFADFDFHPAGTLDGVVAEMLAGQRLVLSGASGFVGSWVMAAVAWLNARLRKPVEVIGVSRSAPGFAAPWYHHVTADVCQAAEPPPGDILIHAAMSSEATPAGGDDAIRDTAQRGTAWALRAAARGARTLLLSSGAAAESTDVYAEAKRAMERLAADAVRAGQPVMVARLYTCLGPGYRAHRHLAHVALFDAARSGGPLRLTGDGSAVRSYLYGADMAAWLLRSAVLGRPGDVFAVGNPAPVTILELASAVAAAAGLPGDAIRTGTATGQRQRYLPELGEPHARMGLAAWTPLARAVERTLALWPAPGIP